MKNKLLYRKRLSGLALSLCLLVMGITTSWGQLLTVTTAGSGSYTVPAGVTSITISTWGGGGAGGTAKTTTPGTVRGGGGAGGSFAKSTITVIPGDIITYTVGAGGVGTAIANLPTTTSTAQSGAGGDTFATLVTDVVRAVGGQGGQGGFSNNTGINGTGGVATTTGNVGVGFFAGGNGQTVTGAISGGGGSSAGPSNSGTTNATAGSGGVAVLGGGAGGAGTNNNNGTGVAGSNPGGGGGGATARGTGSGSAVGSSGGVGKLVIENAASPTITASTVALSGFVATVATASPSQSFTVTGVNLTNDLFVSTASTDYELSLDDFATAGSGSLNLGTTPTNPTTIYVRLKTGLVGGSKTANITVASTGANTLPDVICTGGVTATYYYAGTGLLSVNTNWGTNTDGTGTNPTAVTDGSATFVLRNTTAVSTDAVWVLGTSSKLVIGDATQPAIALTIAAGFQITGGTIDIPAAASGANQVFCQATALPTFGIMDALSEVHLQPATAATFSIGSVAYGKLFIDGAGAIAAPNLTFASTIQTSLSVAVNSTLTFSPNTASFIFVNSGASVTIDGTVRTGKTGGGLFTSVPAFSASTTTYGNFQVIAGATFTLGSASTVEYNRGVGGAQAVSSLSGVTYNNLIIAASTVSNVSGAINVTGTVTVNTGATFNTGGFVTLKSTATKTAVVAPVLGTISGTFIVERYIPAGNRAYRLLSPATTGGTINANWQEAQADGANLNAGFGTHITGAGAAANGFDTTTNNAASLFTHTNTGAPAAWTAVANTNVNTLTAGSPYLIYLRGSRLATNKDGSLTNDATTLRTTGTLATGTQVVSGLNATANGFSLIGNPYQAQVDMQAVLSTSTDLVQGFYYVLNPANGAYSTYDLTLNTGTSGNANQYLQPGQACFVKTVAAPTAPALSFTEANKSELVAQTSVFRTKQLANLLRLSLYDTAKPADAVDGLIVAFDASENNAVNDNDGAKLTNFNENMATSNSGKLLSIEKRAIPTATDEIPLNITKYKGTSYSLKVQGSGLTETPYLVDAFTNTTTEIPQDGTVDYAYTVDAGNAATTAASRFKLIYAKTLKNIDTAVSGFALYPNPSQSNSFNIMIPQSMSKASLTVSNLLGQKLYTQNDLQSGATVTVNVSNVKTAGVYLVSLTSEGKTTTTKWIVE